MTNKYQVILCNVSCLLCQYSLLVYEYIQVREIGIIEYVKHPWNILDLCNIILYQIYFPIRMSMCESPSLDLFSFQKDYLPSEREYRSMYFWKFLLTMINVIQVPVIFMMLMKYLRVIESLGLFILLIAECIRDV